MQKSRSKWLTLDKKLSPLTPWTARRKSWHQKSRPFFHTRNQLLEITTFVVPSSRGPPWSKGGAAPRRSQLLQLLQLLEVVTWRTWRKKHRQKTGEYLDFFDIQCFCPHQYVFSSFSFDLFSFNMFQSSILIWISLISLSLILNITPLFYSWRFLDSDRSSRNDANSICTCNFQIAPFVTSLPFVYELQMSGPWIFKPAPAVGQWAQSSHYFSQPRLSVLPLCTGRPPGLPAQNSQWFEEKTSTQKLKRLRHAKDRSAYFKTMAGQKAYCDKM